MTVVAIVGPTAAGKTALSLELARRLGGEIVNADALQVYRGLDIGTAKPAAEERRQVTHHLIDILDPEEAFSAGEFARRARVAIAEIEARGRQPIVVGGSGLYLRALFEGLKELPGHAPEVRRQLQLELEEKGLPRLYAELGELDPESAARLRPGDTQRVLRALEVFRTSGRTLSFWLARESPEPPIGRLMIGLTLSRTILYDRIAVRVRDMVRRGWVCEVAALLERGTSPSAPAFQAIGYRQMVQHLEGRSTLEAATDEAILATRHYAKRQETWFRKERDLVWFQGSHSEVAVRFLLQELEKRREELTLDEQA
jgi:tRNA dimethylallyltransferase